MADEYVWADGQVPEALKGFGAVQSKSSHVEAEAILYDPELFIHLAIGATHFLDGTWEEVKVPGRYTVFYTDGKMFQPMISTDDVSAVSRLASHLRGSIKIALAELGDDVRNGTVPGDVEGFSDLHDYCDANGYGDAFGDRYPGDNPDVGTGLESDRMSEAVCSYGNALQAHLDRFIKDGGLKSVSAPGM